MKVQVQNPKSGMYAVIDKDKGIILKHVEKPLKGVKIVKST
jgi:hypothetical protein